MGDLGLSLVFVGIVLTLNGVCRLQGVGPKSLAIMNIITCVVSLSVNLIGLAKGGDLLHYQNITAGFLFAFTYFYHAVNLLFSLDWRPFGWYSLFVAVYAAFMGLLSFELGDWRFGLIWLAWAALWLEGFFEHALSMKKLLPLYIWLTMAEGVFTAFLPALLILCGRW